MYKVVVVAPAIHFEVYIVLHILGANELAIIYIYLCKEVQKGCPPIMSSQIREINSTKMTLQKLIQRKPFSVERNWLREISYPS